MSKRNTTVAELTVSAGCWLSGYDLALKKHARNMSAVSSTDCTQYRNLIRNSVIRKRRRRIIQIKKSGSRDTESWVGTNPPQNRTRPTGLVLLLLIEGVLYVLCYCTSAVSSTDCIIETRIRKLCDASAGRALYVHFIA